MVENFEEKRFQNELEKVNSKVESTLKNIINLISGHIYWKDINGVYLGCNDIQAKSLNFEKGSDVVGKTDFELSWNDGDAKKYRENDLYVMQQKKTIVFEETGIFNGKPAILLSQKTPLKDDEGNVFGVLGISLDITDQRELELLRYQIQIQETERLRLENEINKQMLYQQEKFTKLTKQVVHDISSPTAALLMLVESCDDMPEEARFLLRQTAIRINDVAHNLLVQYRNKDMMIEDSSEQKVELLLSSVILQILAEKKLQYANLSVHFEYVANREDHFAFIQVQPSAFKRMLSNLINNAVDALEFREGVVSIKLTTDSHTVKVFIVDTGKGMSSELIDKIMHGVSVSRGKSDGHGIGLTQIYEALENNQGRIQIESVLGQGTTISITFPSIATPLWFAEEICLAPENIVIVLDDDKSIHAAWDSRFNSILKENPGIELIHFEMGYDALNFINHLSEIQKQKVLLLTDYELLKQDINGLDIIKQSHIKNSILVTSHYDNQSLQAQVMDLQVKILPKWLASEVRLFVPT